MTYMEHQTDPSTTLVLQLAFGGDGTLFGQTGAPAGEQDLYYISLVPATLGERGRVLEDFSGGPYFDMSDFNPLCECTASFICHFDVGGPGHFILLENPDGIAAHLANHGDCREADAIFTGDAAVDLECACTPQ